MTWELGGPWPTRPTLLRRPCAHAAILYMFVTLIHPSIQGAFNHCPCRLGIKLHYQKSRPYKVRGLFSQPICANRREMAHPTKGFFQFQAQTWPCSLHPLCVPTHRPLTHPFCSHRTYLLRILPDVTSQDESLMPDISSIIRESIK